MQCRNYLRNGFGNDEVYTSHNDSAVEFSVDVESPPDFLMGYYLSDINMSAKYEKAPRSPGGLIPSEFNGKIYARSSPLKVPVLVANLSDSMPMR